MGTRALLGLVFVVAALAAIAVIEALAIAWLAPALVASYEKRLQDTRAAHQHTVTTLSSVMTLSLKQQEGLEVIDKTLDRLTARSPV